MRIGIDIDDTLTNIKDKLDEAVLKYALSLGKEISFDNIKLEDVKNDGKMYQEVYSFNYDELKYFLKDIQEEITDNAIPRDNVVDIINKLKKDGHEIIIITARDSEFHEDPYMQSKRWLDNNQIYYDKLIVNARNKKDVCQSEKIDLLIDDSLSNCLNVSSVGIKTIRLCEEKSNYENIICFDNWLDIYNYIVN